MREIEVQATERTQSLETRSFPRTHVCRIHCHEIFAAHDYVCMKRYKLGFVALLSQRKWLPVFCIATFGSHSQGRSDASLFYLQIGLSPQFLVLSPSTPLRHGERSASIKYAVSVESSWPFADLSLSSLITRSNPKTRRKSFSRRQQNIHRRCDVNLSLRPPHISQRHLRPCLIDHLHQPIMSVPTASTQEVPGHRVSRIPSRPASRRVNSECVATSVSVSETGSPIASTIPLPARRNAPAMTTASRIPTAFRTPTSTPTYSGIRPRSHVGRRSAGAQSSLPRASSSTAPPAIEARPSSVSNLCV